MKATIEPGRIGGAITAPPSKSLSQRALAAALLHHGTTVIHGAGNSADEQAAIGIIQQLGAKVVTDMQPNGLQKLTITSFGIQPRTTEIDCGESGLAARLFTPIAALHNGPITITGHGSLLRRPMEGISEILPALGVALKSFDGFLPFTVNGPLVATSLTIDVSGSSQLLSGLLFALTACATVPLTLEVTGLESRPYIDLTLDVLAHFGKPVTHQRYKTFHIDPATHTFSPAHEITIEADWSSASCLLVAGAIGGEMAVRGLRTGSLQADRAIMTVLQETGANMSIEDNCITTRRSSLQAFEFDATDCPDLFPALAVLATFCRGDSRISGVHRLFHKESNRVESITELLWSFGIPFRSKTIHCASKGAKNSMAP